MSAAKKKSAAETVSDTGPASAKNEPFFTVEEYATEIRGMLSEARELADSIVFGDTPTTSTVSDRAQEYTRLIKWLWDADDSLKALILAYTPKAVGT